MRKFELYNYIKFNIPLMKILTTIAAEKLIFLHNSVSQAALQALLLNYDNIIAEYLFNPNSILFFIMQEDNKQD